ncbi:MAG TPA: HD domain-containing phosphohydrolase [Roseiflexaceae bacterium]|nr:HD domain-containing phosphohydrolase [Roseiflexaceae bacterium]
MPATILVVDDDPAVSDILSRFLVREGYNVTTARSGREALARVSERHPDLILLDVMMPEMDGFTACQHLKDNRQTALIPITMLTGSDDYENRRRGIEAGADDFLSKPFEQNILRARIRSQLRLKRLIDQLEDTEAVIFTLAQVVEAKDAYTEGHLRRLRSYGHCLADACQLDEPEVGAVEYGGILHDIGKIGVSEAVLLKPGSLTTEEMDEMKRHPEIGARIIAPMRFAKDVAPIIRGHHERWDGTGYPDGLEREDIPIGARIIAIADAYDAMTTDRPYRAALGSSETVKRLRGGRGTQFDPHLLDVFLSLLDAGELRYCGEMQGVHGAAIQHGLS